MNAPWIRFGRMPCIMMMLLSVGLMNHVIIGPLVLHAAGRDAWLAILLTSALLPAWLLLLYPIVRLIGNQPLGAWLTTRAGKGGSVLFLAVFILFLFATALITSVDTVAWSSSTYLPETPKLVTACIFAVICVAASVIGMHVIAYMSCILLPIVIVLGVFVATANIPRKDYTELLPLLEHGWPPVLQGMLIVGGGFIELLLFAAFAGYVDRPFRRVHLIATGLFISFLCINPIAAAIAEFGPVEAADQLFPAFAQWRLVQIGKYIEHVDFFAIYQWLSGAFVRTAGALCLIVDLLGVRHRVKRAIVSGAMGLLAVAASVIPIGDVEKYHFLNWYMPVSFYALLFLFLYLALVSTFAKKEGKADAPNGV